VRQSCHTSMTKEKKKKLRVVGVKIDHLLELYPNITEKTVQRLKASDSSGDGIVTVEELSHLRAWDDEISKQMQDILLRVNMAHNTYHLAKLHPAIRKSIKLMRLFITACLLAASLWFLWSGSLSVLTYSRPLTFVQYNVSCPMTNGKKGTEKVSVERYVVDTSSKWSSDLSPVTIRTIDFVPASDPNYVLTWYAGSVYHWIDVIWMRALSLNTISTSAAKVTVGGNCTRGLPEVATFMVKSARDRNVQHPYFYLSPTATADGLGAVVHCDMLSEIAANQCYSRPPVLSGMAISFIIVGIATCVLLTLYMLYNLYWLVYKQWTKSLDDFGMEYYPKQWLTGTFQKFRTEAIGPLFLVDTLIGGPFYVRTSFLWAAVSGVLHWIAIISPVLVLVVFKVLLSQCTLPGNTVLQNDVCSPDTAEQIRILHQVIAGYSSFHMFYGFVYDISYVWDIRWRVRMRYVRPLWELALLVSLILSVFLVLLIALWLLVALVLNPPAAIAVIIQIGSLILYVMFAARKLKWLRTDVKNAAQNDWLAAKIALKDAGLSAAQIYLILFSGFFIILLLAVFMFLANEVFNDSGHVGAGALVSPIGAITTCVAQIKAVEKKKRVQEEAEKKRFEQNRKDFNSVPSSAFKASEAVVNTGHGLKDNKKTEGDVTVIEVDDVVTEAADETEDKKLR